MFDCLHKNDKKLFASIYFMEKKKIPNLMINQIQATTTILAQTQPPLLH